MKNNSLNFGRTVRVALGASVASFALASGALAQEAQICPINKAVIARGKLVDCKETTLLTLAKTNDTYVHKQMGMGSVVLVGKYGSLPDARKMFEKLAQQGNAAAQANLGVMYAYGWGGAVNYGSAIYWLEEAVKQGEPHALANLGTLYLNGWGVNQDYKEALRLFTQGAEKGETAAMDNLGYLYDQGLGTEKNNAVAAEWYARAAEKGDALGQNNLADMYLRGEAVRQDDAMAFDLFQKSAVQGNTAAQIKLGYMYLNGRGTPRDLEAAYSWIQAASLAGDQRGQRYLVWLKSKLRQEQIQHAENRAEQMRGTATGEASELAL